MKKKILLIIILFMMLDNLFAQDNFNKQIDTIIDNNYYISCYFDVLMTQDRNTMKKFGSIYNDLTYEEPEGHVTRKWYDESVFTFDKFELAYDLSNKRYDNIFHIGSVSITVLDFKMKDNKYIVTIQNGTFDNKIYDELTILEWEKFRTDKSTITSTKTKKNKTYPVYINDLIFISDGDYLNIYYDKDKLIPFATFAKMNDETLEQFKSLIYTNKCDLSKVTWPRHADGTCDYDGSSKKVTTAKTSQSKTSEATKAVSNTNVAVKKTMSTTCNLKLRSGEATSTQVLTVMSAGTKVKILELGKEETIDGINSNWVKVEIISGKDRDGKILRSGMTGWCYGGYLQ